MDFRADNVRGADPAILEALIAANAGTTDPYGQDALSQELCARLSELFEHELAVFPVATGTAANALGIALLSPPWGAVYCTQHAHIHVSECGAPEQLSGGAKLLPLAGVHGKLSPSHIDAAIQREGAVHVVVPSVVSISQATEHGTVYQRAEIEALAELARRRRMGLHMDGARFAHAVSALGATPAELSWRAGVDVLSFGATKNGALAAEAVIVFDRARARELEYRRKRAGHLWSKQRFLSAQLLAYVEGDRWLKNAARANALAARLGAGLSRAGFELAAPVETNQVLVQLPAASAEPLRAEGFLFYDWPALGPLARRLVTAFDTPSSSVDAFIASAARTRAG